MGSLEQAIDSFRRATNLAPEMEWASLGLFHCLWNHNKLEEAFAEMQRFMVDNDSSLYKELMKTLDELGADPKRVDDDIIREFRAVIAQEKIEGKEKTL
jgi:predicted Zn-dependent protease